MKKSKNNLGYFVLGCGILISALVLIFMTLTGIKGDYTFVEHNISVYGMMSFGDETRIGLVLALVFVIAALVSAVMIIALKFINAKFKFGGWLSLCAAVLSLVAGVLFFCGKSLAGLGDAGNYSLGIGSILCGILTILNAFVLGFYAVLELKK